MTIMTTIIMTRRGSRGLQSETTKRERFTTLLAGRATACKATESHVLLSNYCEEPFPAVH